MEEVEELLGGLANATALFLLNSTNTMLDNPDIGLAVNLPKRSFLPMNQRGEVESNQTLRD